MLHRENRNNRQGKLWAIMEESGTLAGRLNRKGEEINYMLTCTGCMQGKHPAVKLTFGMKNS